MKIMIVDDSFIACRLIQLELAPFGYDVVAVDSVERALSTLERDGAVSLVILDLSVAEVLGGATVLGRMRATRPERQLPVILHSALADDELTARRERLGADGAFRKGGRLVELVRQIRELTTPTRMSCPPGAAHANVRGQR
jgi:CheY-like chemotaxis protein